jgi:lipopolysaccharide/colanic/teichoic acid biosynthesis glycosyltransferase
MESVNRIIQQGDRIYPNTESTCSLYDVEKRILDIAICTPLLILLFPLFLLIGIAIKIDSPGPVFHLRKVVGRNRRAFCAFKLRTMITGAESYRCEDERERQEFEDNHKLRCDRRITRVGRFLRKASVDELPQLINVFLGQMSLVGPRMISFPEIEKFGIYQDDILSVKPGITGLWQVSGRSKLPYDERVRLNLYYVKNRTIWMDIKILLKTIPAVLTGNGAY